MDEIVVSAQSVPESMIVIDSVRLGTKPRKRPAAHVRSNGRFEEIREVTEDPDSLFSIDC